jgi:hypothetical protein
VVNAQYTPYFIDSPPGILIISQEPVGRSTIPGPQLGRPQKRQIILGGNGEALVRVIQFQKDEARWYLLHSLVEFS